MIWAFLIALAEPPPEAQNIPGWAECDVPAENDARPFTLCLAEYSFEQADAELNRQWTVTVAHVKARKGVRGVRQLRNEQRRWLKSRDRECVALAAESPTTQSGRNEMSCLAHLTGERTAELRAMIGSH